MVACEQMATMMMMTATTCLRAQSATSDVPEARCRRCQSPPLKTPSAGKKASSAVLGNRLLGVRVALVHGGRAQHLARSVGPQCGVIGTGPEHCWLSPPGQCPVATRSRGR